MTFPSVLSKTVTVVGVLLGSFCAVTPAAAAVVVKGPTFERATALAWSTSTTADVFERNGYTSSANNMDVESVRQLVKNSASERLSQDAAVFLFS
jgi:hypothetical protein